MKKRPLTVAIFILCAGLLASSAQALSRAERSKAKALLSGTLYLKFDAPCTTGRHPFGVFYSALVEVTPEGSNTEDPGSGVSVGVYHASSAYWAININDPVKVEELEFEDDEVEIELEGQGPVEDETTVIKFREIRSLADFEAAFDHAFSRVPLQDLHDDWSPEVKEAIGKRQLVDGMSKRQAFYVTGAPESFEKSAEDGVEVETWTLRENKGTKFGFWGTRISGAERNLRTLRFEDGKLASRSGTRSDFSLDD